MKVILFSQAAPLLVLGLLASTVSGCASSPAAPAAEPAPVAAAPVAAPAEEVAVAIIAEPAEPEGVPVVIAPSEPVYEREDVMWIQQRLQELGYYNGSIDGSAGNATRGAIKSYQNDQDIEADGRPTAELRNFMWRNGG